MLWWDILTRAVYAMMRYINKSCVCHDEIYQQELCMSWWDILTRVVYVMIRYINKSCVCHDEIYQQELCMSWHKNVLYDLIYFIMVWCNWFHRNVGLKTSKPYKFIRIYLNPSKLLLWAGSSKATLKHCKIGCNREINSEADYKIKSSAAHEKHKHEWSVGD